MRNILLISLFLTSCVSIIEQSGPDAQGYYWEKSGAVGTPVIHRDFDVYLYCGLEEKAESCAIIREGICNIYLPDDPKPWQESHELKHCQGWKHPDNNWIN